MIAFLRRGYARSGQIHMILGKYSGVKSGEKLHPGSFFEPRGILQKLNQRGLGHCNRSPKPPQNQKKSHWVYPQQMAKIGVFRIPNLKFRDTKVSWFEYKVSTQALHPPLVLQEITRFREKRPKIDQMAANQRFYQAVLAVVVAFRALGVAQVVMSYDGPAHLSHPTNTPLTRPWIIQNGPTLTEWHQITLPQHNPLHYCVH